MKTCSGCNETKSLTEFHKDKTKHDGVHGRCKSCRCKYEEVILKNCKACGDQFTATGNAKAQKYCGLICQRVHIRYGIDEYKLEDLLIKSNYKCSICGQEETMIDKRTGKIYELAIDHNHETGEVRGVLCCSCNTGLGFFKDNTEYLESAIKYLKQFE